MWWINVPPFYRETESENNPHQSCTKLRSLSQGSLLHLKMFNKNALSNNESEQFESFLCFLKCLLFRLHYMLNNPHDINLLDNFVLPLISRTFLKTMLLGEF